MGTTISRGELLVSICVSFLQILAHRFFFYLFPFLFLGAEASVLWVHLFLVRIFLVSQK